MTSKVLGPAERVLAALDAYPPEVDEGDLAVEVANLSLDQIKAELASFGLSSDMPQDLKNALHRGESSVPSLCLTDTEKHSHTDIGADLDRMRLDRYPAEREHAIVTDDGSPPNDIKSGEEIRDASGISCPQRRKVFWTNKVIKIAACLALIFSISDAGATFYLYKTNTAEIARITSNLTTVENEITVLNSFKDHNLYYSNLETPEARLATVVTWNSTGREKILTSTFSLPWVIFPPQKAISEAQAMSINTLFEMETIGHNSPAFISTWTGTASK